MTKKIFMCIKHFLPKPCKICEPMNKKFLKTITTAHCPKCREKFVIEVRGMKK